MGKNVAKRVKISCLVSIMALIRLVIGSISCLNNNDGTHKTIFLTYGIELFHLRMDTRCIFGHD